MLDMGFQSLVDTVVEESGWAEEIWTVELSPREWSVVNTLVWNFHEHVEKLVQEGFRYEEFLEVLGSAKERFNR